MVEMGEAGGEFEKSLKAGEGAGLSEATAFHDAAVNKFANDISASRDAQDATVSPDDIMEYVQTGASDKLSSSVKESLSSLREANIKSTAVNEAMLRTIDPAVKLTGDYKVDFTPNPDTPQAKINRAADLKNQNNVTEKLTNGEKDPLKQKQILEEKSAELSKKADSEPDAGKRSSLRRFGEFLAKLALALGALAAGIFAILAAMADKDTGCYYNKSDGSVQTTQLDCSGSKDGLPTNCNCDSDNIQKLINVNGCIAKTTNNCDAKYVYTYRIFTIADEFNKVMTNVGADAEDAGSAFQTMFNMLTKYGPYVLIAIVLLVLIPLILSLVKQGT